MTKMQLLILSILGLAVLATCLVAGVLVVSRLPDSTPGPSATPGPTPTITALTFMGQSDDFIIFQNPRPGLAAFGFAHRGAGLFAVELVQGERSDVLAIETGEYDGRTTHRLEAGEYVVNVTADGPWMVVVGLPQ